MQQELRLTTVPQLPLPSTLKCSRTAALLGFHPRLSTNHFSAAKVLAAISCGNLPKLVVLELGSDPWTNRGNSGGKLRVSKVCKDKAKIGKMLDMPEPQTTFFGGVTHEENRKQCLGHIYSGRTMLGNDGSSSLTYCGCESFVSALHFVAGTLSTDAPQYAQAPRIRECQREKTKGFASTAEDHRSECS